MVNSDNGIFDLTKSNLNNGSTPGSVAYMSFWVFSPRSLEDLLLEPNLPTVTLNIAAESTAEVWLNGKVIIQGARRGGGNNNNMENGELKSEPLKLHQGWNQFLVKVTKTNRSWQFSGRLVSNQPEFLPMLESSFDKP